MGLKIRVSVFDACVCFAFLFDSGHCLADDCAHTDDSFKCVKYLHNPDGDTFIADIPNLHPFFAKSMSIRIQGIDTPEISSKSDCERKAALLAREKTQTILMNAKRIDLLDVKKDKYFRLLAKTLVDGLDLGSHLLEAGLAHPYDGGSKIKRNWCGLLKSNSINRDPSR